MHSTTKKLIALTTAILLTAGFSIPAQAGGSNGHHYRHGGHYSGHHSNHAGAYLAGGLILGSLIGQAYYRHQQPYYEPYYARRSRYVVVDAPVVTRSSSRISRRLLLDRNGNCFEKNYNDNGDEILAELDPSECAW